MSGIRRMIASYKGKKSKKFDRSKVYYVGNPTITEDGIYTTNGSKSFVRTRNVIPFSTANTWSFKWRFIFNPHNNDQGVVSGDGNTNFQSIINMYSKIRFAFGNNEGWYSPGGIWVPTDATPAFKKGQQYDCELCFDGTHYILLVDGIEFGRTDETRKVSNTYIAIGVERQRAAVQYSRCQFDLKHTSLKLDGVEYLDWWL